MADTEKAAKPLTIIAPIDDTPAYRAGLQSGDIISHIEGEPTIDMTIREAVRLLKGDKGTQVTITIKRPGLDQSFDVTIERDDVPIESIRVVYMLNDDVGLIRVSNFTSTTADSTRPCWCRGNKARTVAVALHPGHATKSAFWIDSRCSSGSP